MEASITASGVSEVPASELPPASPPPVAEPVAPPPPPPPPPAPRLSKEEACLIRVKAVAEKKRQWLEIEKELAEDVARSLSCKAAYEEARSALGQEEVDFARTNGWIGHI